MKKIIKIALVAIVSLSALFSCQKAEQTSISMDDIAGKATISGVLTYVSGQELAADGTIKDVVTPAEGVNVVVDVSLSSLDPWGNSDGYKTYSTTTDSEGMWSVEVPAVDDGVYVNVKPASFSGTYKTLDIVEAGQPKWNVQNGVYQAEEFYFTDVTPGEEKFRVAQYNFVTSDSESEALPMARLMGVLSYNAGQTYTLGTGFSDLQNVASNVKVNVVVDGYKTYQVETDKSGVFDISVPVREGGSNVSVKPQSFLGTYTTLDNIRDGEFIWDNADVVYEAYEDSYYVYPDAIQVCDAEYHFVESGALEVLDSTVPLTVRVGCGYSIRSNDETYNGSGRYYIRGELKPQRNVDVILTVKYTDYPATGKTTYRNYCGTTDSFGEIDFNIPSKDVEWYDASIVASAKPFVTDRFYYYDEYNTSHTLSGIYEPYSTFNNYVDFQGLTGVTNIIELRMYFEPFAGIETHGYYASDYDSFWKYGSF